jgi:hypothetical protein
LRLVAAELRQQAPGCGVFDAFRHNPQAEISRKVNDGTDDGPFSLIGNLGDERAVDFQLVQWKLTEPSK